MKTILFIVMAVYLQLAVNTLCFAQSDRLDSLLNEIKKPAADTNKVKALHNLSKYYQTNEPLKSFDYAKQELDMAQKINSTEYIFYSYEDIALYYYFKSDLELSHEYHNRALAIAEQTKNKKFLGKVYSNISLLYLKDINYTSALDYSEKAMKIAEDLKDSSLLEALYNNRGMLYMNISDYPTSLNYLLKAQGINEKKHFKNKLANNYHLIGYNFLLQNKLDKALEYFQLSLKAAKEANDVFQQIETLGRIGEVYKAKKDWNTALDYFQRSSDTEREVGDHDNISSLQNMAMIYNERGASDKALKYISEALILTNQLGDKMGTGNNYGYLGEIYMKTKNYKASIPYFINSLNIAREIKAKDNEAGELLNLAKCYRSIGNPTEEANYLWQYQTLRDSIINEETIKKTAEIDAKYSLDKKEKEIALLTKDKQIQVLEIKKQTTLKNSFIVGLLLVCTLSFFIYRSYRIQQRLKLQTLRTKIATDLHDDVGSTLSSISIFSQVAKEESKEVIPMLEQIGDYSRNMLESMADIVWTINPDNDNFEKIILRMRSFAYELLGAKNIDFKFYVDQSVSNLKLSMETRKNLYLIFKEATNNMVKYADANSAYFSIKKSKNDLTLLIRDNGKGFDVQKESHGNGLKNMKARAREIGARFLIESEKDNGTTIQLLIKTI